MSEIPEKPCCKQCRSYKNTETIGREFCRHSDCKCHSQVSENTDILSDFESQNFFNDLTLGQWDNANANAPLTAEGCRREAELVIAEINRTEEKIRNWLKNKP